LLWSTNRIRQEVIYGSQSVVLTVIIWFLISMARVLLISLATHFIGKGDLLMKRSILNQCRAGLIFFVVMFISGALWATSMPQASDSTHFQVTWVEWKAGDRALKLKGSGAGGKETVYVKDAQTGKTLGTTRSEDDGRFEFEIKGLASVPSAVLVESGTQSVTIRFTDSPEGEGSHANRFSAYEGTSTCLACHTTEAMAVHASVHYQWKGNASETVGLKPGDAGKLGGINDFCIYPDINWIGKLTNVSGQPVDGGCAKCHVGLGNKPEPTASRSQLENIDCLICHSEIYKRTVEKVDGVYRFVPDTEKMGVSALQAAVDITLPSNGRCLDCHTKAGGGDNFKRGDLEEAHRNATRSFDVHLASKQNGGAGLSCVDCHTAANHRIAGRGTDLRPWDSPDEVSCEKCHGDTPHDDKKLDKHTGRVNCTVCHIPTFAKVAPTDMARDWSQLGELNEAKGLYEPFNRRTTHVIPEYRFFNGTSYFYQFGDSAIPEENGFITMSAPMGSISEAGARIYAFKHHLGNQPIGNIDRRLLPLKIGLFFETGVIDQAVQKGAEAVGWNYQGYEFARTERFMGLFHEVAPSGEALSCTECHTDGGRVDFNALGYSPKQTYNGKALCASCHKDESNEWKADERFEKIHKKHVDDKKYDCSKCHIFSKAE
jgi:hypothetical protein